MTLAKLTVLFGESDRVDGHLAADEVMRLCAEAGVRGAVLLRAAEGFGIKQQLHTEALLTLSEDLPLAVVAIDQPATIRSLADEVAALVAGGLVTVETATPADAGHDADTVRLSVLTSRREPVRALVERLRSAGMDAAAVLLGLDGTIDGRRRRARFFSANGDVPALVTAIGPAAAARAATRAFDDRVATVERVVVCKRDGALLADPHVDAPEGWWQRLSIHAPEDLQLVRRLRLENAAGATALHGVWGFSGGATPHGDRFLALRRSVPVLTIAVDRPENVARWWPAIDELTDRVGVVTSELVPDARPVGPS